MTTYYIRDRWSGEIINAVETDTLASATKVCESMTDDCYADPVPPRTFLKRYRYWNERP